MQEAIEYIQLKEFFTHPQSIVINTVSGWHFLISKTLLMHANDLEIGLKFLESRINVTAPSKYINGLDASNNVMFNEWG